MKKLLILILVLSTLSAFAAYQVTGDWNGWPGGGPSMTETSPGSGLWQVSLTLTPGRYEFHVTSGSWSWYTPQSGNSWFSTDSSGHVTITYDANTHTDGWLASTGRVGVDQDPGAWTATGDFQGWRNNDPATAMTPLGNGIYYYSKVLPANDYFFRAVHTGTSDAIGADGLSVNADPVSFKTTAQNPLANFYVDAVHGAVRVDVTPVPEPSPFVLGGFGLALLALRRRH